MPIRTNRELYLAVTAELGRQQSNARDLREYLVALRAELLRQGGARSLAPDDFVAAISAAFVAEPAAVDTSGWRGEDLKPAEPVTAEGVDRIVRSQILDLEDAHAAGLDEAEFRSFGLEVPRRDGGERATGSYWFNWDPLGYVECGIAGTFGGWDENDPGAVLEEITWSDVARFLWAGQSYE